MNRKSLAKQFGTLFVAFAVITIVISGFVTYVNETNSYHDECIRSLQQITEYLEHLIQLEGHEFIDLQRYFNEQPEKVLVPEDFHADLPRAREAFYSYIEVHYPGKAFGIDLFFDDLDEEARQLYVCFRFEYWFCVFFDAVDAFNLSYIYFLYPVEGKDHTMNYMFDPSMVTQKDPDGRDVLILGDQVYEDPALHKYMWIAWNTGRSPKGFDSLDNEYGYVYTYCQPLVIDSIPVGLICADTSVEKVTVEIASSVFRQVLLMSAIYLITTVSLFLFLNQMVLRRVLRLESLVRRYSQGKDPAVAVDILSGKKQDDELGSLSEEIASMITELDDYMLNLQKITAEKERISAELNVAAQIQADMLPRIFPVFPTYKEFDIYASMSPAKEVGGDFYDFFIVDEDHLALVIADVSGKGVPAALFMVIAKTLVKNRTLIGEAPSDVLYNVNDQLCEGNDAALFVTVWLAVIDLNTGEVLEVNAGHEYPAICRAGGSYELIRTKHSPAVAIFEGLKFRQTSFKMNPGDTLFVYTDGVTEATNAHNELFGDARLLEALNKNPEAGPEELLPAVRQSIDAFVGDAPQFDDITMLGFRFNGRNKT